MKTKLISLLFIVFLSLPAFANIRSFYGQNGKLSGNLNVSGNADITGSTTIDGSLTVDTDTLYVDDDNNRVGVRTSAPGAVMTVVTAADSDSFQIRRNSVSDNDPAVLGFRNSTGEGAANMAEIQSVRTNSPVSQATELYIKNYQAGGLTTAMFIDTTGNIGIGTESPQRTFSVSGDVQVTGDMYITGIVGNEEPGNSLIVKRSAPEGDNQVKVYVTAAGNAIVEIANSNSSIYSFGSDMTIRSNQGANALIADASGFYIGADYRTSNPYLRLMGYITADTAMKYVDFTVDDTDDKLHVSGEDAYILGMSIDIPLEVSENISIPIDKAFNIGNGSTEGDWRFRVSGNNMVFERYESSVWVNKGEFTP